MNAFLALREYMYLSNGLSDYQHALFLNLFEGKLAFSPVDQIPLENVLDLATGTGKWAIDFADQYPKANVIGTDLSPIQPT